MIKIQDYQQPKITNNVYTRDFHDLQSLKRVKRAMWPIASSGSIENPQAQSGSTKARSRENAGFMLHDFRKSKQGPKRMHFNKFILISAFWCCVMAIDNSAVDSYKEPFGDLVLIPVDNKSINFNSFLAPRVRRNTMDAENLEKLLNRFIGHLKSFIHTTFFDSLLFERQIETLSSDLNTIARQVKDLDPKVKNLSEQLRFAEHMFQVMESSADQMGLLNQMGRPDQALINKMFEYNVLVFKLYNTHGALDYSVHEPAINVLQLWRQVRTLEAKFGLLNKVSILLRRCFERQLAQAKKAIIRLWAQVSKNEEIPVHGDANCF